MTTTKMTPPPPSRTAEEQDTLEAAARRLMAQIAATHARGYDTHRARQQLITQLDQLLDEWNGHTPPPPPPLPAPMATYLSTAQTGDPQARICGVCSRTRYPTTTGARICVACDAAL